MSGRPRSDEEFEDIRPYRDDEVDAAVARLLSEPELLRAVVRFRFPRLAAWLGGPLAWFVQRRLARRFAGVGSVAAFQDELEAWFDRMIAGTTLGFTWSGLHRLEPDRAYLFVSNHRDIALDSGFTNYALHAEGRDTSRIAIGDNLLKRPWMTDLMRLNKSFVVRRSPRGVRATYRAYRTTSRFVHRSIAEGESVWIAQREGRAKDGCDRTEPALVKMLHMAGREAGLALGEAVARLHVVPVAISYELDPCDAMKAHELHVARERGHYDKPDDEDIRSIVTGIVGFKGRVHLHFGEDLGADRRTERFATPEAVAVEIDRQVVEGFRLFPTHLEAYRRLEGRSPLELEAETMPPTVAERFAARLEPLPEAEREVLLEQYANPVRARLALRSEAGPSC